MKAATALVVVRQALQSVAIGQLPDRDIISDEMLLGRARLLMQRDVRRHARIYRSRHVRLEQRLARLVRRDFARHPEAYTRGPLEAAEAELFPGLAYRSMSREQRRMSVRLGRLILAETQHLHGDTPFACLASEARRQVVETVLSRLDAMISLAA